MISCIILLNSHFSLQERELLKESRLERNLNSIKHVFIFTIII